MKLQRQPSLRDCRMPDGSKVEHQEASSSLSDTCMDTFVMDVEPEVLLTPMASKAHQHPSIFPFLSPAFYFPLSVN